ncbi:MAG: hypothetical protein H0X29_11205 [Parachlamydiaceae bacterium]|nr:hypothetical protein [Parachlamydiaceae bacterium]
MRETVRVSFDVFIDEHTFVKSACVEAHINFRDLMFRFLLLEIVMEVHLNLIAD